ncbi:MAG: sigma-70 family RNA polymerase sigma factor [Terracidiphilus sp.]
MATKPGSMDYPTSGDTASARSDERSDEQLMAAFSRGSAEAFTELFTRYRQPLFGYFWRRIADRAQAEELTQETFVAVIRAAPHYEPEARFRTYLYSIALNLLRAYRRKAAFRATFWGLPKEQAEPSAESGLDEQVLMREALRQLDGMDREVLLLREFEQLSYAEIAEILDLPVNTVRSRLFRARVALRERIEAPRPSAGLQPRKREEGI